MLTIIIFINAILLVLSIGFLLKLMNVSKLYNQFICDSDAGRIVLSNGQSERQKKPVIRM